MVNKADLAVFADKVRTKLENTLGIFLSINGFSSDGVASHQAGGASILLVDGGDLMAVLEERIDFTSLLLRKKRHAARTGQIYRSYHQMVASNGVNLYVVGLNLRCAMHIELTVAATHVVA